MGARKIAKVTHHIVSEEIGEQDQQPNALGQAGQLALVGGMAPADVLRDNTNCSHYY